MEKEENKQNLMKMLEMIKELKKQTVSISSNDSDDKLDFNELIKNLKNNFSDLLKIKNLEDSILKFLKMDSEFQDFVFNFLIVFGNVASKLDSKFYLKMQKQDKKFRNDDEIIKSLSDETKKINDLIISKS